jgi:hypothetical protein
MSDQVKRLIVLVLNLVASAILGLAAIYGWPIEWWGAVTMIVVIVLDTWAGIEWIPPKRPSNDTGGSG